MNADTLVLCCMGFDEYPQLRYKALPGESRLVSDVVDLCRLTCRMVNCMYFGAFTSSTSIVKCVFLTRQMANCHTLSPP